MPFWLGLMASVATWVLCFAPQSYVANLQPDMASYKRLNKGWKPLDLTGFALFLVNLLVVTPRLKPGDGSWPWYAEALIGASCFAIGLAKMFRNLARTDD